MLSFIWNPEKAMRNEQKHGVAFSEATTIFADPLSMTIYDPDHSDDEDRYLIVGTSDRGRMLIVAFTERGDYIRIISARCLTRVERREYEQSR